jgi:hypothetical protein
MLNFAWYRLQFGFIKGVGCNDVSFTLKTVINHFTSSRSNVFSAARDIRKAFDRVPHGKLIGTPMSHAVTQLHY